MAKAVTEYECEICSTSYATMQTACECEHSHKKPVRIIITEHYKEDKYPIAIRVRMEDGYIVEYYRRGGE